MIPPEETTMASAVFYLRKLSDSSLAAIWMLKGPGALIV